MEQIMRQTMGYTQYTQWGIQISVSILVCAIRFTARYLSLSCVEYFSDYFTHIYQFLPDLAYVSHF